MHTFSKIANTMVNRQVAGLCCFNLRFKKYQLVPETPKQANMLIRHCSTVIFPL